MMANLIPDRDLVRRSWRKMKQGQPRPEESGLLDSQDSGHDGGHERDHDADDDGDEDSQRSVNNEP